eukprot:s164_g55.t1
MCRSKDLAGLDVIWQSEAPVLAQKAACSVQGTSQLTKDMKRPEDTKNSEGSQRGHAPEASALAQARAHESFALLSLPKPSR